MNADRNRRDHPNSDAQGMQRLATEVQAIARPRAICRRACIESKGDDGVTIEGIRLSSHERVDHARSFAYHAAMNGLAARGARHRESQEV